MDLFEAMKPITVISQILAVMDFTIDSLSRPEPSIKLQIYCLSIFCWKIFCQMNIFFHISVDSFLWDLESFSHMLHRIFYVFGVTFMASTFVFINTKQLINALALLNREFFIFHNIETKKIYRFNIILAIIHLLRFSLISIIVLIRLKEKMEEFGVLKGIIYQLVRLSVHYYNIGLIIHYIAYVYLIYKIFGTLLKKIKRAKSVKYLVQLEKAYDIAMDFIDEFNYTNGVLAYMVVASIFGEIVAHTAFISKHKSFLYWQDVVWVFLNGCELFAFIILPQITVFQVSLIILFFHYHSVEEGDCSLDQEKLAECATLCIEGSFVKNILPDSPFLNVNFLPNSNKRNSENFN